MIFLTWCGELELLGKTTHFIPLWHTLVGLLNWASNSKNLKKKNIPLIFRGANRTKKKSWHEPFIPGFPFSSCKAKSCILPQGWSWGRDVASGRCGINDPSWTLSPYCLSYVFCTAPKSEVIEMESDVKALPGKEDVSHGGLSHCPECSPYSILIHSVDVAEHLRVTQFFMLKFTQQLKE